MNAAGRFLRAWRGKGKYTNVAGYCHFCPGCKQVHSYTTESPDHPLWGFDGNFDLPTFTPSMKISVHDENDREITVCHYFIKAGQIEFCGDSGHKLKGQTVPLPEWPHAPGTYGGIIE